MTTRPQTDYDEMIRRKLSLLNEDIQADDLKISQTHSITMY